MGIIIRTLLTLLCLLLVSRILGRRTLSEITFYDFVIGLVLGNIGGAIITDQVSVESGIIILVISTLWVLALNFLSLKSIPARKLIEAEPLQVISKGKILEEQLKKRYYNVNDLLEMLREQEIFDPGQVETALIESDGHLSVLKKPEYQNPSKDLYVPPQALAGVLNGSALIIDGTVIDEGLTQSGLTFKQLQTRLHKIGVTVDDLMLAMLTPDGKLYIDKRKDK